MYASWVIDVAMERLRPGLPQARGGIPEEGWVRVFSRARLPWNRRPDPDTVAASLIRGIRSGAFTEGDVRIVVHEAACAALAYFSSLANRGYHVDTQAPGLSYDIAATLFAEAPRFPLLHRYVGDLVNGDDPDPMHIVRKFRRTVRTYAHNRFLEMIGEEYPHERRIRRQVHSGATELHLAREGRRLCFVASRLELEPISSWAHIATLSAACPPGARVRDLLAATRQTLEERTDVAGWIEISDLVSDYWWFFRAPFTRWDLGIAPGSPFGDQVMREFRAFWQRLREPLREKALTEWEGPSDVAERDFGAFSESMDVVFTTGRHEDRWTFWASAFPEEVRTQEEFRNSRHRRRADSLWRSVREAFLEEFGPDFGMPRRGM